MSLSAREVCLNYRASSNQMEISINLLLPRAFLGDGITTSVPCLINGFAAQGRCSKKNKEINVNPLRTAHGALCGTQTECEADTDPL